MLTPLNSPIDATGNASMHQNRVPMQSWITAILLLPIVGLVIGSITTGLGDATVEAYKQVTSREFATIFQMLAAITFTLINVVAVAASSFISGAIIGGVSGAALSIGVVILALITARGIVRSSLITTTLFALLGSAGAAYGALATASASDLTTFLPYVIGGMIFGIFAANSVIPKQSAH